MKNLIHKTEQRINKLRAELEQLSTDYPDAIIGEIGLKNLLGGMRGMQSLVCNSSYVDPYRGLFISDHEVPDFEDKSPEELFFLLLTGEFPSPSELDELHSELVDRSRVPDYVWKLIHAVPKSIHPMTLFSMAILAMEGDSVFKQRYAKGIPKNDYWIYTLEDALNLIAKLPALAAGIYRHLFLHGTVIDSDSHLPLAESLTYRFGFNQQHEGFAALIRLYLVLHCDHEGGNVSAFTARIVNSALSNLYYAASAGLNGLAGPLHGLANQECLHFIRAIHTACGNRPSVVDIRQFVLDTLDAGKVIPGYGHAVLRVTDPRFTAFQRFGAAHCSQSGYLQTVNKLFEIVPPILQSYKGGKVANPWPNVDAISGSLLYHYGMTHYQFYTVLFGVSRILGFAAQNIIARGLHQPIIRPKSVTNAWLRQHLQAQSSLLQH